MYKVTPNFHQGINFVQISSLPFEQQSQFYSWIPQSAVMELMINGIAMNDCVEYQDYTYWFDFQFKEENPVLESAI